MSQTIVITGGSSGIGLATALRFARRGNTLLLAGRRQTELDAAAAAVRAKGADVAPVRVDLASPNGPTELLDAIRTYGGRVDVLVNNAGAAPYGPIECMTDEAFELGVAVNVRAVFALTRGVWPLMRAQGGGIIVNVSSLSATDPFPGLGVYGASKAWVNLFTHAAAAEGKPHNIRVYAVAPGAVETPLLRGLFAEFPADQTLPPDAIAAVIESLCTPAFAHSSGQTIVVRK
jgi:NAD(P)-dependent dehydrogenase (short-subunit alcohol dehydrogenase family)